MTSKQRGGVGGGTGSVEYSPDRVQRMEAAKARTERRWAAKAGPVEVHYEEPKPRKRRGPRKPLWET